jgi:hypothetical protein
MKRSASKNNSDGTQSRQRKPKRGADARAERPPHHRGAAAIHANVDAAAPSRSTTETKRQNERLAKVGLSRCRDVRMTPSKPLILW